MHWFLLTFLTLICLGHHVPEADAIDVKLLQSAATEVVGTVFCDTCLRHQFSKTSHFIPGSSVLVNCLYGTSVEAKTDGSGQFRARLSLFGGQIKNCTVKLISSSDHDCSEPLIGTSCSLRLKSKGGGVHTFTAGFLTFKPVKLPRLCRKLKAKITIPIPRSIDGSTTTNSLKHKKLIESSTTQSFLPGLNHKETSTSFPEAFFPPFPLPTPPFFPPVPGFTPPPLVPLPPVPGLTPPPPLIPLPPVPGFTPPSPPPLIPLPPVPIPWLNPPPPPPLFPLPPVPGFTPPSPPPAPFLPIPLPPVPIPGLTPPPPPPPPPPAFPIPLPPFPPLLPPSPGNPPPSSMHKANTTP